MTLYSTRNEFLLTDQLETITKPADEFVESFCEQLKTLLTHSFIAKQQSLFQVEVKFNLQSGVFQVIADFSENILLYSKMNLSLQFTIIISGELVVFFI